MAREISDRLRIEQPARAVEWVLPDTLPVRCDPGLMRVVLENLLSNACG